MRYPEFWAWLIWVNKIDTWPMFTIQEQVENFTKEFEKWNQK